MKQFYDQTYRNALGKMVKPYGVKVGQADLPSDYQAEIFNYDAANLATSGWILKVKRKIIGQ
jgi:thymidine kinase